jgi:branched-chain amino acid aminotransferase
MADIAGKYYSEDIVYKETSDFDAGVLSSGTIIYEVIRIFNGTALFVEDHIERLQHSVLLSGFAYNVSVPVLHYLLRNLIRKNNISVGNVKIVLRFDQHNQTVLYTFLIPHAYPDDSMYLQGVKTDFFRAARKDPNIKKLHPDIATRVSEFIKTENLYDALLVTEGDQITEGSKTNIFFIKDSTVYTAPGDTVLRGITREKVIYLCNNLNIKLLEKPIEIKRLAEFDASFFTGTSPKVLPINAISNLNYQVENAVMRSIMKAYDDLIAAYIFHW